MYYDIYIQQNIMQSLNKILQNTNGLHDRCHNILSKRKSAYNQFFVNHTYIHIYTYLQYTWTENMYQDTQKH